jgi:hypothetical protein
MTFRTPTGQTGIDAYTYEPAQIENARRELLARFDRLRQIIADELPAAARGSVSIASEAFPDARHDIDRASLVGQLTFAGLTLDTWSIDYVRELLAHLTVDGLPDDWNIWHSDETGWAVSRDHGSLVVGLGYVSRAQALDVARRTLAADDAPNETDFDQSDPSRDQDPDAQRTSRRS